jgi:hypothetical protein
MDNNTTYSINPHINGLSDHDAHLLIIDKIVQTSKNKEIVT